MSRFDPSTYPDRLAFDAYARQIRAQEFDRLTMAAASRLSKALSAIGRRKGHPFATSASRHSHA
jgi:hypothetical protein